MHKMVQNGGFLTFLFWQMAIAKAGQKLGQGPCTIVHGLWLNFAKNKKERILHFYIFVSVGSVGSVTLSSSNMAAWKWDKVLSF